jgi:peptidoglycan/xylan/chitin deacetylase (PgdA/CDA1 family)
MYHRFEENKYPSTNIKINDFKQHLKIIKDNKISFVDPKKFENELKNSKSQRKVLLTIDDGFLSFMKMPGLSSKKKKYHLFYL